MKASISAVVLTKNEEKNIVDCLESLAFCSEIIVIDDNSEDRTVDLAKKSGAEVFTRDLAGNFSDQRNFGLEKAKKTWVFFVDADERVSEALAFELSDLIHPKSIGQIANEFNGFYIKRDDFMWGKQLKYGEAGNIKLLRLAKKDAGHWHGAVHETWRVKEKKGELTNPLNHYPHESVEEFLKKINFYTDLRAEELHKQGIKANWFSVIFYPKAKFFVNYFFKIGFLDGTEGLIVALLMSFHSFLVRGKLWLLWYKK